MTCFAIEHDLRTPYLDISFNKLMSSLDFGCLSFLFSIFLFNFFFLEMPLRTKKQVVEKYLEGRRLTEEKLLLEKEMTGFLKFYKDTVIPEILSTIESLKAVLSGMRTAFPFWCKIMNVACY